MSYNYIINHIVNQEDEYIVCKFKFIMAHEGLLISYRPKLKGYWYNVIVEWDTGETTKDIISVIASYYPVT